MIGAGIGICFAAIRAAGASAIAWLLSFNLNLTATVGDDAVMAVGSDTTARVWDETTGLALATVTAGNPVSEGMRLSGNTFLNDDGSGNKLTPSKLGSNGEEVMLVHEARANAEAIVSEAVRVTATSDPHSYWYTNQTLASPTTTSLTEPLRDSQGRYLEQLAKNGSMAVDSEWSGTNWAIGAGVNQHTAGSVDPLNQDATNYVRAGQLAEVTYTVGGRTAGAVTASLGTVSGTVRSVDGTYTDTITSDGTSINFTPTTDFDGSITDVSVVEVDANGNPSNILDGGRRESGTNLLWPSNDFSGYATSGTPALTTGVADPWGGTEATTLTANAAASSIYKDPVIGDGTGTVYTSSFWVKRRTGTGVVRMYSPDGTTTTDFAPVLADGEWHRIKVTGFGSATSYRFRLLLITSGDAVDIVYGQAETGTEATEYIPTTTATVTVAENVSESVLWSYGGRYNNIGAGHLTHVLNEPEASNLFLNSEVPVTQNITTTAQNYTVSVWGTGSVTLSGTATGVATQDSPLTVTATAGTLTCTVAGALDIVQVETGDVNTTFIPTLGGTVTRAATSFTVTPDAAEYLRLRFAEVNSRSYLSSGTVDISYDGTTLTVTDGTNAMTHVVAMAVGDQMCVEESTGKLYYNGVLVDTNALYDPTWGEITLGTGNACDVLFSADIDPTDITWDDPA